MKTTLTLVGLLFAAFSFGQNTEKSTLQSAPVSSRTETQNNSLPTAVVVKEEVGSSVFYRFVSHRVLSTEQAERWEVRYPTVYTEIVSISIDPQTQEVEIELPVNHDTTQLQGMISRFGYSNYAISN